MTPISQLFRAASEKSDLLTAYFAHRGLDECPASVMLLTGEQTKKFELAHPGAPALVAPIIGPEGLQGAYLTFLTPDGQKEIDAPSPCQIIGNPDGGYVKVSGSDTPIKHLIVATTIIDAAAAAHVTGLPAIAALSLRNHSLLVPPECTTVTIAAEKGKLGMRAAEALAYRLIYFGLRVSIAYVPKKDGCWADALSSNDAVFKQFKDCLSDPEPFEPAEDDLRALPAGDFVRVPFPPQVPLCGPWLQTRSLVMLHAERGAGKTWLALAVAQAVATGTPLLGWPCDNPRKVLYIDGELPGDLIQDRLHLLSDNGPLSPNLRILSPDLLQLRGHSMPDLGDRHGREALDEEIERENYGLIFLDSISTLVLTGVENDAASWAPLQAWSVKHRSRGRTLMFLHHDNRKGAPRGTSKKEDVLDTMQSALSRCGFEDNASIFELSFSKHRRFFGADAATRRLSLSTASGAAEWNIVAPPASQLEIIQNLLAEGKSQKTIADKLGLTPGRISQIISDGKKRPETPE